MNKRILISVLFFLMLVQSGFCKWEISFGKKSDNIGLNLAASNEVFPLGPCSFRVVGQNLWVLDSINGRILCFDSANSLVHNIAVPDLKAGYSLVDFAVSVEDSGVATIIVADTNSKELIVLDGDGKVINIISDKSIKQIDEIDMDQNGWIYVGDYSSSSIMVFSIYGVLDRVVSWMNSGFAIDNDANLVTLEFNEKTGYCFVTFSSEGNEIARQEIGMAQMQAARLWHIDSMGRKLVSFSLPESGDEQMQLLSSDNKVVARQDFSTPFYMNRYLTANDQAVWLVKANYFQNPEELIRVDNLVNK